MAESIRKIKSSMRDSPADTTDSCFLDAEPSTSFKHATMNVSSRNVTPQSGGKRKISFRKISIESSNLPLNDDCSELNEEKEKSIAELEKSMNQSANRRTSGEDEPDVSIIKTMTEEQMNEHVSQCLQLSTENKINTKNAFALKLIDCMTMLTKNEDKSNFAAMACQLDAGAKIYSLRVDAVHQQVMKLVETCMYAEKKKKERDAEDDEIEEGEDAENKEKKRKTKKKVLATNDQISRIPKEDDPRDKFLKIDALPGEILKKANYDPTDLSLTLEKNIPFWLDMQKNKPLVPKGEEFIPDVEIKDRSQRPKLDVESTIDRSCLPKLSLSKAHTDVGEENEEFDGPMDVYDSDPNNDDSDVEQKKTEELELVSIAKLRMASEGSNVPSTTDVIKTIFHSPGESDYHYLKMDSQRFWAGPSYWKRPQGHNLAETKKRASRKKKEPVEVLYTDVDTGKEIEPKDLAEKSKKTTTLSKRTMEKWSTKKTTLPQDIHFDLETFNMLFHMNIVAEIVREDSKKESEETTKKEETDDAIGDTHHSDDMFEDRNNDSPQSSSSHYVFRGFTSPSHGGGCSQEGSTSPFNPEQGFQGFSSPSQAGTTSPCDPDSGFRGFGSQEDSNQSTDNAGAGPSSHAHEVYDGENLVPMVRTVKVEPIKFVAKPSRVDMQHLKQVMLSIIRSSIEDRENELKGEGEQSPRGSVSFKDVLVQLYNSDRLHSRTREDLTTQMAFLSVLTLANENNFSMTSDVETGDFLISYAKDI